MTNTKITNLKDAEIAAATKRAQEAEDAAKKAKAALREAEEAAERAKAEAAERGKVRAGQYLQMLQGEYQDRRKAAAERQAKARAVFEDIIAGEEPGNVFEAYHALIRCRAELWGIETEIAEARNRQGGVYREPRPISMSFVDDTNEIITHLISTAQDAELQRIRTRLRRFMAGDDGTIEGDAA